MVVFPIQAHAQIFGFLQGTFHSVGHAASMSCRSSKVRVDDVDLAYAYPRVVGLPGENDAGALATAHIQTSVEQYLHIFFDRQWHRNASW
jgi:phage terminase large subunit GpA-like protein